MKLTFTILFGLSLVFQLNASDYYVSKTGDDFSTGNKQNPWRTLAAATERLTPGDRLFILPGVYNEYCTLKQVASAEHPIIITTEKGGEHKAIIDGSNVQIRYDGYEEEQGGLVQMVGAQHIHISNISIVNSLKEGIIAYESAHVTLDNIKVEKCNSSGIAAWNCEQVRINDCTVENACLAQRQEYITIAGTQFFEVTNCTVGKSNLGSVKEGIDAKDGSRNGIITSNRVKDLAAPGIYLDAWTEETSDIEVFNNLVENCNGIALASEGGGLLHNIKIYNNICVNNINYGIVLGNWGDLPTSNRPIKDIKVYHNTIIKNGRSGRWGGGISLENRSLSDVTIANNIVSNNHTFQINNESNLRASSIISSNNIVNIKKTSPDDFHLRDSIHADPKLVKGQLYQLSSDSPAIDAANPNVILEFDFLGLPRNIDGNSDGIASADIGAIEFATPQPQ